MKEQYKIVLIHPFVLFSESFDYKNTVPTHLISIATYMNEYLKKNNISDIELKIISLIDEENIKKPIELKDLNIFIKTLKKYLIKFNDGKRLIFGISCFSTFHYLGTIITAEVIKRIYPRAKIAVGGLHATLKPEDFILKCPDTPQNYLFDFIFTGEADFKFTEVIVKNREKIFRNNREAPKIINCKYIKNIDKLPIPDFGLIKYRKNTLLQVPIYFSRGCPFNCNFCSNLRTCEEGIKKREWSISSIKYAMKVLESTIKKFENMNVIPHIQIADPLFGYSRWRMKLFEKLIEKEVNTELWAEIRIDNFRHIVEAELLKKLNFSLAFGIESGSPTILRIMNKTNKPTKYLEKMLEIMDVLNRSGVYVFTNFIIGSPGETHKTLAESFDYMEKLYKYKSNGVPSICKYLHTFGNNYFINISYYKSAYGTEVKYPDYWKIPACQFVMAGSVNPSRSLNYKEVINLGSERGTSIIKNALKNLTVFNGRRFIYNRYFHSLLFADYPFWKAKIRERFEKFEKNGLYHISNKNNGYIKKSFIENRINHTNIRILKEILNEFY